MKNDQQQLATIINGKEIAALIQKEVFDLTVELQKLHNVTPGLAVVLVGERKDSQTYVRMKKKVAKEVGFFSLDVELPDTVSEAEIIRVIDELNHRDDIHGILVQLPLPSHVNEGKILEKIAVQKDVDGFSATNIGNFFF